MVNITRQGLQKAKVAIQALGPEILRLGDNSQDVKKLQLALSELNLFSGAMDGNFCIETANAVRRVQCHLGLEETGVFNHRTWYGISFWSNELVMDEPLNNELSPSSIVN